MNKDISQRILMGQTSLQTGDEAPQAFDTYQLVPELPNSPKKRAVCIEHISDGAAAELQLDFDLGGVRFPEADEPQEITTQLTCKGVRCILRTCGLTITQFDSNGAKIGEMKQAQ